VEADKLIVEEMEIVLEELYRQKFGSPLEEIRTPSRVRD